MGSYGACPSLGGTSASSVARRYVRDVGTEWDGEALESALLATSELVTNATRHGGDLLTSNVHTCSGVRTRA